MKEQTKGGSLRKPDWLKVRLPGGENYTRLKGLFGKLGLNTVCEEAQCPNVGECWGGGTATIMLLGDICTRGCRFCAVNTAKLPGYTDYEEPARVARAVAQTNLTYLVMTMVNRDDLPDGGAEIVAQTIEKIKQAAPEILIEMLISDFDGNIDALRRVMESDPEVLAHNIEVVERLTPTIRDPRSGYEKSLEVLRQAKAIHPKRFTKSSIMVGLGERPEEVRRSMKDLHEAGVDFVTLGQYLRPTPAHAPVVEYVPPSVFEDYRQYGQELGFKYVASGPLVRSSYRAGEFFIENMLRRKQ